ncbi:MAG: hypothetical protein WBB85_22230 [Albidovulum sp.]|uniref:hypothetical protein n=1 Tax=Albidovulum sp. TaxID=1872424 RepID=UPI003CB5F05B
MTTRTFRTLIASLTCLAVIAMGLAAAMTRGQTRIGGQVVVLCSGGGLVQITLDAEGEPTGGSHLCPDLVPSLLTAIDMVPAQTLQPAVRYEVLHPEAPVQAMFSPPSAFLARGPPVSA